VRIRVPAVIWCKDKKVTVVSKDMRLTAVIWYKNRVSAAIRRKE
jgi:predicted 2-oxoglutarate/Fe(II)-dependent dioxygenase YbiX